MAAVGVQVSADGKTVGGAANFAATSGALSAAMAVLVADGAAPTQAHVTTADSALTALLAAEALGTIVRVQTTVTRGQLRRALDLAYTYLTASAPVITGD